MSDHNEAVMVAKGMSPVHVRLRSRLASLLAASVALDLVASVVIYFAEQGQPAPGSRPSATRCSGPARSCSRCPRTSRTRSRRRRGSSTSRSRSGRSRSWPSWPGRSGRSSTIAAWRNYTRTPPAWMMSRCAGRVTLPGHERSCDHHVRAGEGGPRRLGTCRVNRGRPSARRRARRGGPLIRWAGGAIPGFGTAASSAARTAR